ncbi:NmrA family NAD(P)-binding protein [Saccharopolyspora erythraea]|uniref:NmrA family NAD(P)-binding protein n=1 Tax=Saccharopolyspora erythraea TaxID=1836 RepID=UPI001BAAFF2F|nr:NAD(P)H-binding protein [Saccharopolyspora erythraea]QUH03401.1 NmrA family NAD(P)-binding protein [Saccharopolyspora erythraea]
MTILVTGATGNVGRHVVDQLLRAGRRVRALTRNPATAKLPEGVEVVAGDLSEPASLAPALAGVTAMHLITFDGADGTALRTGPEIVRLAEEAGVRRVTMLWSGERGPVERAVEASGLEWTALQPVEFMANALGWADSVRSEGVVREPFADVRGAVVHEADIAAVAVRALTEDGHAGAEYVLSGPEALTVAEKVGILSSALGRPIDYTELSMEQARERLLATGAAAEVVDFVIGWHADPPPSAYTVVPTVERITRRPARTFAQWAEENVEAFLLS